MTAVAAINLITGDAGRSNVQPDFSKFNWARAMYGSEGGYQEAYYEYDGSCGPAGKPTSPAVTTISCVACRN